MKNPLRLALLISGGGTTARRIISECHPGGQLEGKIQPALLTSSNAEAGGIEKAKAAGFPPDYIKVYDPQWMFVAPESFGEAILMECRQRRVDLIGQYGWMPLTPDFVIDEYVGRMINQHPGPLDPGRYSEDGENLDFGGKGMYGMRVHTARLYFVRKTKRDFWTEVTAQRVARTFDGGALLKTRRVEILPTDDPVTLKERVLPIEHEVQIETLLDFAEDRVQEFQRDERLVRDHEIEILRESKKVAKILFPKG